MAASVKLTEHSIRADLPAGANMWVIFFEVAIALMLLLLIVWATLPKRRRKKEQEEERNE